MMIFCAVCGYAYTWRDAPNHLAHHQLEDIAESRQRRAAEQRDAKLDYEAMFPAYSGTSTTTPNRSP